MTSLQTLLPPQAYQAAKAEKIRRQAQKTRVEPPLPLLEWMSKYRRWLKVGLPFDLLQHEYLRGIYADDHPECVYMKAAQMGISEYLISWIAHKADQQRAVGLYIFPTDTHVSDFSAARLGPAIDPKVSPYLAGRIVPAMGGARGADRVGLKRIGDAFVYFRGGKVDAKGHAPQLKSVDADVVVRDEVDEMDTRVKTISEKRLEHSLIAAWRAASTPTFAEAGIHAEYLASDRREWHVRCGACGERQPLELAGLVLEWDALDRPLRWNQEDGQPFIGCRKCGARLDRSGAGEWVPQFPGRPVHGYLVPGLASSRKPLTAILDGLQSTDETERQETYNQGLGLTYITRESESLTEAVLNACRRDYAQELVPGEVTYAGIDVGRVLNLIIRAKLPDGNRHLRHAGQYQSFDEAARQLTRFNVKTCVIDALPETRKARELQKAFPRLKVWLSYFAESKKGSKDESPAGWDAKELSVSVDRTRAMDATFAQFHNAALRDESGNPLPGNTLPADARAIRDYYAQLTAPERILRKDAQGSQVAVYVERNPDHYAFAELYAAMAMLCPYQGWARGSG